MVQNSDPTLNNRLKVKSFMSKRSSELYIVDIFLASFLIGIYTKDIKNGDELLHRRMHWDAVIREFEIIGEATGKLLALGTVEGDSYRIIVDFRNKIAHGYFGIDEEIIFAAVTDALPQYINQLYRIVKDQQIDLILAIDSCIVENAKNDDIVQYLNKLKNSTLL